MAQFGSAGIALSGPGCARWYVNQVSGGFSGTTGISWAVFGVCAVHTAVIRIMTSPVINVFIMYFFAERLDHRWRIVGGFSFIFRCISAIWCSFWFDLNHFQRTPWDLPFLSQLGPNCRESTLPRIPLLAFHCSHDLLPVHLSLVSELTSR